MTHLHNQKGFSLPILLAILLALAVIALGGWYVWKNNQDGDTEKSASKTSQSEQGDQDSNAKAEAPDPYENWQSHENVAYGISFKYPADWKVREEGGTTRESTPAYLITTNYAIILELKEEFKYNETISIEVLNQPMHEVVAVYDSSESNVTKTTDMLKGKDSVQYVIDDLNADTKIYLFSVGDKTYLFRSVNEWLNLNTDTAYWTKFDKIFESLQIK